MRKHLATLIVISCIVLSLETTAVPSSASEAPPQAAVPAPVQTALAPAAPSGATTVDPARNSLELEKLKRESEKLAAETRNLEKSGGGLWGPILALIGAIIGALLTFWASLKSTTKTLKGTIESAQIGLTGTIHSAQKSYEGSLETARKESEYKVGEAIHEKRMELYPNLMKAMRPLAIYFPTDDSGTARTLDSSACREMGQKLTNWYFDQGGLYLSRDARDRYLVLAAVLMRASSAGLRFPRPGEVFLHPRYLDDCMIEEYRARLGITQQKYRRSSSLDGWDFALDAPHKPDDLAPFANYVLLQTLSSYFRTELTKDLDTRRPPAYKPDVASDAAAA